MPVSPLFLPTLTSPRIESLRTALTRAHGDQQLVQRELVAFWDAATREGTPLIEPFPQAPDAVAETGTAASDAVSSCLVTFLWRGDDTAAPVVLISEMLNGWWWNGCANALLTRLDGSDVFYRTYQVGADARFLYRFSPHDPLVHVVDPRNTERLGHEQPDALNPQQYIFPPNPEDADEQEEVWSLVEMPTAPPQPWITAHPDTSAGYVEAHSIYSEALGEERRIWVYTPPNYTSLVAQGHAAHALLLFDGDIYTSLIPTPTILDNLLAAGRIPPMIAIFVDNAQNRLRDLNCYAPFDTFVAAELWPWLKTHYAITTEPQHTVIGGVSLGGVAAAYSALRHSDRFGCVLAQSGAFWNGAADDSTDTEYEEWLARQFAASQHLPLRFYLEAGLMENQRDITVISILRATRHLRDVLLARGYDVRSSEFNGGHQFVCWRGSLAQALITLQG